MLLATRQTIAKLGLVCALLVALATMAMPVESLAGQLDAGGQAVAEAVIDQPCETADCTDCGPACAHGCCHGSLVVMTVTPAALPAPFAYTVAPGWTHRAMVPLARPSGPDRPPRS